MLNYIKQQNYIKNKMKKVTISLFIVSLIILLGLPVQAQPQFISTDFIFDFAAYGDPQNSNVVHLELVDQITPLAPSFTLNMGDIVQNALLEEQWTMFKTVITSLLVQPLKKGLDRNYYPTIGNHDIPLENYQKTFELTSEYYSFDYQGYHFISLDTEIDGLPDSQQYSWLQNDLSIANQSGKKSIVFFHEPLYGRLIHYTENTELRNAWTPLFQQNNVKLVFNGHAHIYQRTYPLYDNAINYDQGIIYITTGGAGGELGIIENNWWAEKEESVYHYVYIQITNSKIIISAVNEAGQIFDNFEIINNNNEKNIISTSTDQRNKINFFSASGKSKSNSFYPLNNSSKTGVRLASGDIDLDGKDEIITGAGQGEQSLVKIFESDGRLVSKFHAFKKNYLGGIDVAAGDINNDGQDEIAVSKLTENSQTKIFNYNGKTIYFDKKVFKELIGATVALGDIDNDKQDELIIGTNNGIRSKVIFYEILSYSKKGKLKKIEISPFKKEYTNGIDVSSGDINGDGKEEIGISKLNKKSKVKIYKYNKKRKVLGNFNAFNKKYVTGTNIDMFDTNSDGITEIISSMTESKTNQPKTIVHNYLGNIITKSFLSINKKISNNVISIGINKNK